jgi:hypothetical protein
MIFSNPENKEISEKAGSKTKKAGRSQQKVQEKIVSLNLP